MYKILNQGVLTAMNQKRVILLNYMANLMIISLALLPFMKMNASFGGFSLLMQEGFDSFDYFADVLHHTGLSLDLATLSIGMGIFALIIINLLFSGGIFSTLKERTDYSSYSFWGGAFEWFIPIVRLGFWLIFYLVVLISIVLLFVSIIELMLGDDPYESWIFWLSLFQGGLYIFVFFMWRTLFDWGKSILIKGNEKCSRKVFVYVIKNSFKVKAIWGVAIVNALIAIVLFAFYISLKSIFGNTYVTLFIAQFYLVARLTLKFGVWGSMWAIPLVTLHKNNQKN